jgi:hypothetical protein
MYRPTQKVTTVYYKFRVQSYDWRSRAYPEFFLGGGGGGRGLTLRLYIIYI